MKLHRNHLSFPPAVCMRLCYTNNLLTPISKQNIIYQVLDPVGFPRSQEQCEFIEETRKYFVQVRDLCLREI